MDARGAAMRAADGAGVGPAPQIGALLAAVLVVYVGQTTLNPVIAPLPREVGLAAWQVGLTISTAAAGAYIITGSSSVAPGVASPFPSQSGRATSQARPSASST